MTNLKPAIDFTHIFDAVEFPDAYKTSYVANAVVTPTYEDIRRDFNLVRSEYHLLLCLAFGILRSTQYAYVGYHSGR